MAERPRLPSDWLGEWHDRNGAVLSCNFTLLPRGADGAKAQLIVHRSEQLDHIHMPLVVVDEPTCTWLEGDTLVLVTDNRALRPPRLGQVHVGSSTTTSGM